MAVRPPRLLAPKREASPVEQALDHEVMGEKAGTLGRLGERLRVALARLEAFDAAGDAKTRDAARREALVDAAAEALWHVAIQRELMGLPRTDRFLREVGAPAEVVNRMGVRRAR